MKLLCRLFSGVSSVLNASQKADFIAPLLLRVFLAPIFIMAGWGKLSDLDSTAYYFGEYLGMPLPELMAFLAGATEFFGGWFILLGFAVRLSAIPLAITMAVAALTAHWQFGWHALPEQTLTMPWEWRTDLIDAGALRKERAVALLQEHGNYSWLSEAGSFTVLKNGIEFAATYFIMLIALFFTGGGRWVSIDWYIDRYLKRFES
ncbi:DoxX family protein [Agaribacterium sp. ZY112]|uniref:HvfX family Cu-binding RiPP maturation protein n=1 Tax=Agaribacterium sp. ZY112 TaxID=3233574 RepID=UPI0035253044